MSILHSVDDADFGYLKQQIGVTDGNLSVHMSKLEEAKYVSSKKAFIGKKPRTTYRMTRSGRRAYDKYVTELRQLLDVAAGE